MLNDLHAASLSHTAEPGAALLTLAGLSMMGPPSWHALGSQISPAHAYCRRRAIRAEDESPVARPVAFAFGAPSSWERFTVRLQADTSKRHMP